MIVPEYLKPGCGIGVTAPSHPIDKEPDQYRFQHAAEELKERGYDVTFTPNVFAQADKFGRSGTGQQKAEELHSLIKDRRKRVCRVIIVTQNVIDSAVCLICILDCL